MHGHRCKSMVSCNMQSQEHVTQPCPLQDNSSNPAVGNQSLKLWGQPLDLLYRISNYGSAASNIVTTIVHRWTIGLRLMCYSFFLYCNTHILPAQNETHIIVIIIIIIIWVIFEINSEKLTKITSRSIARTWASTIVDNTKINTEITLIQQSYRGTQIEQSDQLFLWASENSKIIPVAILLF